MEKTYVTGKNAFILGDFVDYTDFSQIPGKVQKRRWVPNWLWRLVSEVIFELPSESSVYNFETGTYARR